MGTRWSVAGDGPSRGLEARARRSVAALGAWLYRAKLIVYGSLLVVGTIQIVMRERFPEVHPPWPLIGGALMVVLLGVVLVPPIVWLIRAATNRDSGEDERHGQSELAQAEPARRAGGRRA